MINSVVVVGYGVMGRGIVASFARGGHQVTVLSRNPKRINDLPEGVTATAELPTQAPDLVIEAIPEQLTLKIELLKRIDTLYGDQPIIGTNTSGLSMDEMAAALTHPERFIGIHYFQPADALPAVEVIRIATTSDAVVADVEAALQRNGQQAVVINRPIAGFIANRLQHAMLHEAFSLIEQGVTTAADVDRICKSMFGPRMCVTGLIEQKDISGLTTTATVQRTLVPQLNHTGQPVQLLQDMVANNQIGVKSGQGFYDWRERDVEDYKRKAATKLQKILAILAED